MDDTDNTYFIIFDQETKAIVGRPCAGLVEPDFNVGWFKLQLICCL